MAEIIERKIASGKTRYYVRYVDSDGKRKMRDTKQANRRDAERIAAEVESRKGKGMVAIVDPTPEEKARKSVTVAQLVTRFTDEYRPPKLKDANRYHMDASSVFNRRVLPFRVNGTGPTMGDRPAASVTALDVERLRDSLARDNYAANSVRHTLRSLSRLFTWGRRVGAIDCANPVSGIERPPSVQSFDYLDATEVSRLLEAAERAAANAIGPAVLVAEALHMTIAVAAYCGLRKGELFGLRWRDVALDAGRLDVWRSYRLLPKSNKARHVPINPELVPMLRRWKERCPVTPEALVLPVARPSGDGWHMGRHDDDLGLPALLDGAKAHRPADGRPWHMLRHTFASHFVMRGGSILSLQKLLGHSDLKMTMIYAHLAPDFMQSEIARMTFATSPAAGVVNLDAHRGPRA